MFDAVVAWIENRRVPGNFVVEAQEQQFTHLLVTPIKCAKVVTDIAHLFARQLEWSFTWNYRLVALNCVDHSRKTAHPFPLAVAQEAKQVRETIDLLEQQCRASGIVLILLQRKNSCGRPITFGQPTKIDEIAARLRLDR